jgi:hypothetical protein
LLDVLQVGGVHRQRHERHISVRHQVFWVFLLVAYPRSLHE